MLKLYYSNDEAILQLEDSKHLPWKTYLFLADGFIYRAKSPIGYCYLSTELLLPYG